MSPPEALRGYDGDGCAAQHALHPFVQGVGIIEAEVVRHRVEVNESPVELARSAGLLVDVGCFVLNRGNGCQCTLGDRVSSKSRESSLGESGGRVGRWKSVASASSCGRVAARIGLQALVGARRVLGLCCR